MASEKIVIEAEVKSNIGDVSKETKNAAGEFKILGVSLNGVKAGFASAAVTAKGMFGTIKAGLISTGIGAFVVIIGSLVSYFTNTKRGADKLSQALTAVGATIDVLTDRISRIGEIVTLVFSGEFKKAGEIAKNVFAGITTEIGNEVAAMVALKKRTQELRDADNEFMIQKAATRQEIEKARLNAEDETKSAAERLEALKKALTLEEKTTNRELELARERLAIQEEEMRLSENSAEDEQRLAQLKVELIETETASVKMRRRVVTEVNALENEIHSEEKARAKEKQDLIDEEFSLKIAANDEWNKEQQRILKEGTDAEKQASKISIALAKKVAKEKADLEKFVQESKMNTISMGFQVAGSLAKEGSVAAKGIAVAGTIFNTQQSIMKAMADVPYPYNIVQASLNGIMGAAAIQKILSTDPSGAGVSGGGGGSVSAPATPATPAPQMMSGAFDISGGVAPEPTRAYVVTDEMSNSQNQLANIRRRATI